MTAAEALQLGIVDEVTDRNTLDAAVKFALSVAGKMHQNKAQSSAWNDGNSLF